MSEDPYTPIFCGDIDLLELACMHRSSVEVRTDEKVISGTAVDLLIIDGADHLILMADKKDGHKTNQADENVSDQTLQQPVRFDHIRSLRVFDAAGNVSEHTFRPRRQDHENE